eukprot:1049109-Prymnesium_polylepis.2
MCRILYSSSARRVSRCCAGGGRRSRTVPPSDDSSATAQLSVSIQDPNQAYIYCLNDEVYSPKMYFSFDEIGI